MEATANDVRTISGDKVLFAFDRAKFCAKKGLMFFGQGGSVVGNQPLLVGETSYIFYGANLSKRVRHSEVIVKLKS